MVQIGDLVQKTDTFSQAGVVVEKKGDGSLVVDSHPQKIEEYHKYLDTTGLTESEKIKFNDILDEVYEGSGRQELIQDLQDIMDDLRKNPENDNIIKYLKRQQIVLTRTVRATPRYFTLRESSL